MNGNRIDNSDVPKGWTYCPLANIAGINAKPAIRHLNDNTEVSFLPMSSVEALSGRIDLSDERLIKDVRKGYTSFTNGDILFAKITPCMENGKIAIAENLKNGVGFGSTEFHVIRLLEIYVRKLFFYFLTQEGFRKDAQRHMTGSAGQLRVSKGYLEEVLVPIPPHPEQQRIVAKIEQLFSDLDAGVEVLQEIRKQIRQYRQSVLKYAFEGKLTTEWRRKNKGKIEPASKLLERIAQKKAQKTKGKKQDKLPPLDSSELPTLPDGWEYYPLDEFVESMKNGIYKPKEYYADKGTACLRMYNIEEGNIVWKDIKRMTLTKQEIEEYGLVPGDLLINRVNSRELVGKTAVIPENMEMCVYESKNIRLRLLSKSVRPQYIGYWFLFYAHLYFNSNAQQVVGMASINQTQICQMPIPICSYLEQEIIVTEIDRNYSIADKLDQIIDSAEKQSNRLRQSILKRAFEGKLVSQDPKDEPAGILLKKIQEQRITSPTTDRRTIVRSARKTKGKKGS